MILLFHCFPATSEGVFQEAATTDSQQHTAASTTVQQENGRGKNSFKCHTLIFGTRMSAAICRIELQIMERYLTLSDGGRKELERERLNQGEHVYVHGA